MFTKYDVLRLMLLALGIVSIYNSIGSEPKAQANEQAVVDFVNNH